MLCYAVRRAQEAVGTDGGSLASRRRQMIETITCVERAWTLACGVAEGEAGNAAVDGLRGVRAVHRWLQANRGKDRLTAAFALLSNQVRYGGIGAYSNLLEAMHLADMDVLPLRPLGAELAEAFPDRQQLPITNEEARLPVDALREKPRR